MNKRIFSCLALIAGCLAGCLDGGTEIPDEQRPGEVKGREFLTGGKLAAGAEVKLVPVGHIPDDTARPDTSANPILTALADAQGRFAFQDVPKGQYNILASLDGQRSYRDSLAVPAKGLSLDPDTLAAPGSLAGTVLLQPQHDPQSAVVQVLGTQVFVNVGADGSFLLPGLGAGAYRLRVAVHLSGYVPLFKEVTIRSGRSDTLPEPLRPFYSGIPVVTGLKALPGQAGTLIVRWNRPAYGKVQAYIVYRDTLGAILPSETPYRNILDTSFSDTIYRENPGPGQYPWQDTVRHPFRYRVKILDLSGMVGPAFGYADGAAVPPTISLSSGLWSLALAEAPFQARAQASVVVFQDKLWVIGGVSYPAGQLMDAWSSGNGSEWKKRVDSLPFGPTIEIKTVSFRGELWAMGTRWGTQDMENFLWKSPDGLNWTLVADTLPFPGRTGFGLTVFKDRLWMVWGISKNGVTGESVIRSSEDGVKWTVADGGTISRESGRVGIAELGGILHVLGGDGFPFSGMLSEDVWKTGDGISWTQLAGKVPVLPRYGFSCLAHAGKLWVLGGPAGFMGARRSDEVWSSTDGSDWTLADAHAPFGARVETSVASFQGRLWVIGGAIDDPELAVPSYKNDIWVMETP